MGSWFQFPDNSHLRRARRARCRLGGDLARAPRPPGPRAPARASRHARASSSRGIRLPRCTTASGRPASRTSSWSSTAGNGSSSTTGVTGSRSSRSSRPCATTPPSSSSPAEHSILHTNDARLSVAQLRRVAAEAGRPPDLMGVQMSGASWHPICYDYPSEVMESVSASKRMGKFKAVSRLLRSAPPRIAMPYAGPPCFLDPSLQHHNAASAATRHLPDHHPSGRLPRASACRTRMSSPLLPGDRIDLGTGSVERDPRWDDFSFDDARTPTSPTTPSARTSRDARRSTRPFAPTRSVRGSGLATRFSAHFEELGTLSDYFLHRIGMVVRFRRRRSGRRGVGRRARAVGCRVDLSGGSAHPGYQIARRGSLARRRADRQDALGGPLPVAANPRLARSGPLQRLSRRPAQAR